MGRDVVAGIDVGTSMVHVVIGEFTAREDSRVAGIGIAPAAGMRKGVVTDLEEAANSIGAAWEEATREAGVAPKSAFISIGGPHLAVASSRGVVAVSRADGEISEEDARRVIQAAETFMPKNPNREIIHIIPREFRVDNEGGIKDPLGMNGVRLEVDAFIIDASAPALKNLTKCIENAACRVDQFVFSPLASAEAVLSKRQKELGVILVDIGGATTNFAIFEEGRLAHAGGFPYGAAHITNDIAIMLKTRVDIAEAIKLRYGHAIPEEISKKEIIRLSEFMEDEDTIISRKEIAEIIEARFSDIFELVNKELKKINRTQLLPAGAVLIGGGAKIPGVLRIAKQELRLPVELGELKIFAGFVHEKDRAELATAIGLVQWGKAERGGSATVFQEYRDTKLARWLKRLYSLLFP